MQILFLIKTFLITINMHTFTTTLLLALTARLTLAAPTTTPNPLTILTTRATYQPGAPSEDDYCGEAVPSYWYTDSAPLMSDCLAIPAAHPGPGYWTVSADDTNASSDLRFVRIATSGTCAFEVRWAYDNDDQNPPLPVQAYRFGTNDLQFYINSYYAQGSDQSVNGRLECAGNVECWTGSVMGVIGWRLIGA